MKPAWYVVLYAASPPRAVPFLSEPTGSAYCSRLRSERRPYALYKVADSTPQEVRLLEALACVSGDERLRAMVALNHVRISDGRGRFAFWACSVCHGDLYAPTECGSCCEQPNCAVFCGCRCPSELAACDECGERVSECACAAVEKVVPERPCFVCGRPNSLEDEDWCALCNTDPVASANDAQRFSPQTTAAESSEIDYEDCFEPQPADCPSDDWPEICNACYGRAEYGQTWCKNCIGLWEDREIAAAEARLREAGLCIQCGATAASSDSCCAACSAATSSKAADCSREP